MKNFKLINIIAGWITFSIATIVYLSTIEPSASFWDCGEFIASAFKLEVGHPPGAPFFMIMGRFFTLFAGDNVELVAKMVNSMSALFSAFTILFLFWSVTYMAKRLIVKDEVISTANTIAIIGCGLVGALAYTFSDTFWFSAVEGEVYASSSLFTAIVFWAILKWEGAADEPYANRWIIFIAYMMGLSIGVHLLNLLAIPAIVLVYYFRKYEVTTIGIFKALIVSALILGGIMYIIIPGFVKFASLFELMFVNGFGLPYNSGIIFYGILVIGLIIFGLYITIKKKKVILNTAILAITVILIGYSSYAMLIIRSNADTPMDQNDPEDMFSLLYYLNREQYGDRPLFHGQYFNAPVIDYAEGKPSYFKEKGKYSKTTFRVDYVYDKRFTTLFPRMWSGDEGAGHFDAYMDWAKIKKSELFTPMQDQNGYPMRDRNGDIQYDYSKPKKSPDFGQNLTFMWRYQIVHMYFRYFMWNFAGRQNDIQGNYKHEINKGNWICGIPFIDNVRLGDQNQIPDYMKHNKARNRYFLLPLLLGIAGLIYQYKKHRSDFHITLVLFIMTGLAIVFYLNQYPLQPRERDYAYAGSFYAFAIWIGLGVAWLYQLLRRFTPQTSGAILATLISLVAVPVVMGSENWDDHDRSGRYIARDFAYNYLNSCDKNAVLFTNGDNDTFPLWYAQEVEGIRTDVRVMNLSYLAADWYIEQMQRRAYESAPVPFSLTEDQYRAGKRELIHVIDRIPGYSDLKEVINFVGSDDPRTKQIPQLSEKPIDHIPTPRFYIPVDSAKVLKNGTVPRYLAKEIKPEMAWQLNAGQKYLTKNHLMILDLLANNSWERPIYYAITVSDDNYLNLENYFQMEGLAYRVIPVALKGDGFGRGGINSDVMFENMVHKFHWGGIEKPGIYLDENVTRMLGNYRSSFARLALQLASEGKKDSALQTLNRCVEVIPESAVPYNGYNLLMVEAYFQAGDMEKGLKIANAIKTSAYQDMAYFRSLGSKFNNALSFEKQLTFYTLNQLKEIFKQNQLNDQEKELDAKIQEFTRTIYFSM